MKKITSLEPTVSAPSFFLWRGLGLWNLYFLGKLALYWGGYINFDLFYNILLLAVLVLPLRPIWLHRLRSIVAIPFGIALLYYDTWFPPFKRLIARPEVLDFSNDYIIELLGRFINWELIGLAFIFFVVYLFLAQWLRMTFFSLVALLVIASTHLTLPRLPGFQGDSFASNTLGMFATESNETQSQINVKKPSKQTLNDLLDSELESFYQAEKERRVELTAPASGEIAFDLLFINICSLSWSDLQEVNLLNHSLFKNMDVIFDDFNSVTSYSGPAVTRLMQANCGQLPHDELYESSTQQCSLFDNLRSLGFDTSVALNQPGEFQDFGNTVSKAAPESKPLIPADLTPALRSFYDAPLWRDSEVLNRWLEESNQLPSSKPKALLYNTVTLHDGNREPTADGGSRPSPYEKRANTLFNDLEGFINELRSSGRKALVVFIPEHGASLVGDKMQISGMREIPTPEITHVPVGVSLVGAESAGPVAPIHIAGPSSFLGLAELVNRIMSQNVFEQSQIDWPSLTADLPKTQAVSENEGVVIMNYEDQPYVRLQGKNWIKY